MRGTIEHEYDTEEGEVFDLEIEYEYAPYIPGTWDDPPEGGGCEEINFKVVGYRQYDEDGNVVQDLEKLTPEQTKELTAKFEKMADYGSRLYNRLEELCNQAAEDSMQPDWD